MLGCKLFSDMDTLKKKVVKQSAYVYLKLPPVTKNCFSSFCLSKFPTLTCTKEY